MVRRRVLAAGDLERLGQAALVRAVDDGLGRHADRQQRARPSAGATIRRERRAMPRSSASMPDLERGDPGQRQSALTMLEAASVPKPRLVMSVSSSAK